jgi:hypothetical protein
MPSYTSTQRGQITQFVSFTQTKESVAAKVRYRHLPDKPTATLTIREVSQDSQLER